MTQIVTDSTRASRLNKAFLAFLKGRRSVATAHDAELFLEAVRGQPSPSSCLENILANQSGLQAVRHSVRVNTSAQFICVHVFPFIAYLSHPDAKAICEGQLLQQIVAAIVEPPTAWRSMLKLYVDDSFLNTETSTEAFAWLCLEIVSHPGLELAAVTNELTTALGERPLVNQSTHKIREFGYRIRKILETKAASDGLPSGVETAGGRHDNDFADFRKISVYPTTDEFASTIQPFYRRAVEVANSDPEMRPSIHLDNQFRLLREDMLAELRDDIRIATGRKKGKRPAQILSQIFPVGIDTGDEKRGRLCALLVKVYKGLEMLHGKNPKQRKHYLTENPNVLRHQAFGTLCLENEIIGFAFVVRDVDKLVEEPPVVGLQFPSSEVLAKVLMAFQQPVQTLRFVLVDTPVFAYEPVLERLKIITQLPLEKQLLRLPTEGDDDTNARLAPARQLVGFIQDCRKQSGDAKKILIGSAMYNLDVAQLDALAYALESSLSVIQGPPGTGKSFIGALAAQKLLEVSSTRILVLSYTNHALDQFLEDIMKIGIKSDIMTRLGSKSSAATACLSFENEFRRCEIRRSKEANSRLYHLKEEVRGLREDIEAAFNKIIGSTSGIDFLDYLEFSDDIQDQCFWRAFQVPSDDDGYTIAGKNNKQIQRDHLFDLWQQGNGPGVLSRYIPGDCKFVWSIPRDQRAVYLNKWWNKLQAEQIEAFQSLIDRFNEAQGQIDTLFNEARCSFIKTKRVIGCTTTAAAKYSSLIRAAMTDCILVEEAGEILEAHILSALNPSTKQLILIGDHKQLRPKCKNYALTIEKGDGYDLNRSLFERLILQGHPYATLCRQHRMVPEISQLIRAVTYPGLLDGDKTLRRPRIRGICGRVVFINHEHPEVEFGGIQDRRNSEPTASKQNNFEAQMVLKLVKYIGQQGYKTDEIVVLTPYLGQLRLLRDMLNKENDPVLSDLDSAELIRAGLLTAAAGKVGKGQIRLSTIDNYQGEESDIVIASLTRSNNRGDVGFMKAPERLNVLVSRARNCLIMIGNMDTFLASPQGKDTWIPFFRLMKEKEYLQDGLWVRCEQHTERTVLLSNPEDFDSKCPDGGCSEACGAKLKCELHVCQRRCHRPIDHSNTPCNQLINKTCEKQHNYKVRCNEKHLGCGTCLKEEEAIRRLLKKHLEIEKARLVQQAAYQSELQAIQDEIAHQKRLLKVDQETEDHKRTLEKHQSDLVALKETNARKEAMKKAQEAAKLAAVEEKSKSELAPDSKKKKAQKLDIEPGSARDEWEYLKREELARSDALDTLMGMIGLEDVKKTFLGIKAMVDTAARQRIPTTSERFGCTFLGNPGTGKTTVARIYAKFLTSMGVIAGSCFKETTGSKLANMGVSGCQKLLDDVLNEGGGIIFIDEAYQLSSGNSSGGLAVLDFLLAEVENLNSKVCFILAGYAKQMESFFAHNPGFPSRFPLQLKFEDYTDQEILKILELKTNTKYDGRMKAEDGLRGLYCRIVARRLGSGRGKEGFGNARAVENMLARIGRRQSERLRSERRAGLKPDDLLLKKEDLIGPEPSNALLKSEAWSKLQNLIGLTSVKESVGSLVDSIRTNYQRELKEEPIIEYSLNRVFLGSPGTGKTTTAKLYGQILVDLGMLSNGEVIIKNPSDFVGSYVGHSEKNTKGILAAAAGKVLVIDEAYGLYGGGGSQGGGSFSDPYKSAVVDTIVAEVQSTPGDDRCVLLLGYKDQMEEMFQNVNPGLSRRFPLASAFVFEDFNQKELARILDMKIKQQGFGATENAKRVALEMLDRARNRPNFGNAGEVDILLNDAKSCHQKRLTAGKTQLVSTLEALDFDEDFDRLEHSNTNVAQLFKDSVGCERIVSTLQGYQETVRTMKALGLDPKENVPFNFLFRGPPGTGKSTTARKMGQVFYDAGFLASADVLDCSASDLIGQYIGQTGPKVRQLLDKALGRVLLIDEAYRLAEGHFAKEALDEIVDATTKPKYHKRLIIILAGYEGDINRLLNVNPGLTSRFPEVIDFYPLEPTQCLNLLLKKLQKQKMSLEKDGKGTMDITCLELPSAVFHAEVSDTFKKLSVQSSWASARDVETLAQAVFQAAIKPIVGQSGNAIFISEANVRIEMDKMLSERESRAKQSKPPVRHLLDSLPLHQVKSADPNQIRTQHTASAPTAPPEKSQKIEDKQQDAPPTTADKLSKPTPKYTNCDRKVAVRDAGVSDEIWDQLQKDAEAEEQREREYQAKRNAKLESMDDALRERILKELIEEEERRKKEAEAKKKLAMQGRCPMGYDWIRQAQGWRCAGGSHFVSEAEFSR
ncbi:ATPase [Xylariaceae sp. FL1651]|nr:ATPase [Xylariaceae sp. FL1651]